MSTFFPRAIGPYPDAKRVPSAFAEIESVWNRDDEQSPQDQGLYTTEWEFHEEVRPAAPSAFGLLELAK